MGIRKRMTKKIDKMLKIVLVVMGFIAFCGVALFDVSIGLFVFFEIVAVPVIVLCISMIGKKKPMEKKLEAYISNFVDPDVYFSHIDSLKDIESVYKDQILRMDNHYIFYMGEMGDVTASETKNITSAKRVRFADSISSAKSYFVQIDINNPYFKGEKKNAVAYDSFSFKKFSIQVNVPKEKVNELFDLLLLCNPSIKIEEPVVMRSHGQDNYSYTFEKDTQY